MTKIETIFGGVLAAAIFGIFAVAFFLSPTSVEPRDRSALTSSSALPRQAEEPVAPQSPCDCYSEAYDLHNLGQGSQSVGYQSGLRYCYERFGREGSAAFEAGFIAAEERGLRGRVCRPGAFK
ncbi:MAG: hypothetical protein V2I43_01425 [Parvularcula sp.]|jgi:hypothetical protein|nr:hypothetical protein [Parvularcula sp.]